jgi:hypothetical protein
MFYVRVIINVNLLRKSPQGLIVWLESKRCLVQNSGGVNTLRFFFILLILPRKMQGNCLELGHIGLFQLLSNSLFSTARSNSMVCSLNYTVVKHIRNKYICGKQLSVLEYMQGVWVI